MRAQVESIDGILLTDDMQFAEFEMPQISAFGEKDSPKRIIRFSYSACGVANALIWLEEEVARHGAAKAKVSKLRTDTQKLLDDEEED